MSVRGDTPSSLRPSSPAHGDGRLQRTSSHELLTAHPLLSPGPSSLSVSTSVGVASANSNSSLHSSPESTRIASGSPQVSAPKYLPYTPRQARAVTGSATTGTASSPVSVSPQQQHVGGSSSATSRLQLQNLKAVAQNHGLDVGCLGWAMLEELVGGSDHASAWSEIWSMLATGKATLLLPTEQASSHETITPEMMKDHIIFCNGSARNDAPVVTLSGLRGTIDESTLKFQSTLATESKSFKALSNPSTRSSTLLTLPPLPIPSNPAANYSQVFVQTFIPSLPIPPRSITPPKPPLPPRPGSKPVVVTPNVSRLSNPFASFFSKPSATTSPASTPQHLLPDVQPIDHVIEVSAFTTEQPIVRRNVSKALTKCIKAEIKDMLAGSPTWVVERTIRFSAAFFPFSKPPTIKENTNGSQGSSDQNSILSVSANNDTAEEVSQAFQNFYDTLEEELKVEGSPSMLRRKDDKHNEEERRREQDEHDKKVQDTLERVERALTCVFYDRLFAPSDSDDASHDETLSSRIAALNMLELSLEHLGVDAGDSKNDVDRVVSACGETISQLSVARCPADKAAILIASHRIIVDGLSRLPPLRLKSEEQIDEDRTPQAPTFDHDVQNSVRSAERTGSNSPPKLTVSPDPSSPPSDLARLEESGTSETIRADALEDDGISIPSSSLSQTNVVEAPLLTVSPPKTPTPVSGDILLPLIIFSVVKANPSQLVSHLLFTQRFRNQSVGGEESYCLIDLMAVVEFLENVDLGALGLKESEKKVMSAADLTPIPLAHLTGDKSAASTSGIPAGLRGRVEQQVDALAGSANKVFSGVVDSGFGVFRSLLPTTPGELSNPLSSTDGAQETAWNSIRPGFGLLRRESGFSIASLAASLPGAGGRDRGRSFASSHNPKDEEGQEMVESRPVSVRSMILDNEEVESEGDASVEGSEESGDGEEEEGDEDEDARHDTRSIRSFESMMSRRSRSRQRIENAKKERMSLSDRLAHMSRLTKGSKAHSLEASAHQGSPPPRSSMLLSTRESTRFDTPLSSRTSSPVLGARSSHIAPPNRRFLECTADDLKMSEIPELLQEYRRLVENMRSMGAFDEHS